MWIQRGQQAFSLVDHFPDKKVWMCRDVSAVPPSERQLLDISCSAPSGTRTDSPQDQELLEIPYSDLRLRRYSLPAVDESRPVEFQNLQARPDLNGGSGFLQVFDYSSGRWRVAVPTETLKVRSCNLVGVCDPVRVVDFADSSSYGCGLRAAQCFAAGDVIFEDRPILVGAARSEVDDEDGDARGNMESGIEPNDLIRQFQGLSARERAAVLDLADHGYIGGSRRGRGISEDAGAPEPVAKVGDRSAEEENMLRNLAGGDAPLAEALDRDVTLKNLILKKLCAIFDTNCFETTFVAKDQQIILKPALFLGISRANHSCAPNAIRLNIGDGIGRVVALKPITHDEEITLSYLGPDQLRLPQAGRGRVLAGWKIAKCLCTRCAKAEDDSRVFTCRKCAEAAGRRVVSLRERQEILTACDVCGGPSSSDHEDTSQRLLQHEQKIEKQYFELEHNPQLIGDSAGRCLTELIENAKTATIHEAHWLSYQLQDLLHDFLQNCVEQDPNIDRMLGYRQKLIHCVGAQLPCLQRTRSGSCGGSARLCQAVAWAQERLGDAHAQLLGLQDYVQQKKGAQASELEKPSEGDRTINWKTESEKEEQADHLWHTLRNYELAYTELRSIYSRASDSRDLTRESHLTVFNKMRLLLDSVVAPVQPSSGPISGREGG